MMPMLVIPAVHWNFKPFPDIEVLTEAASLSAERTCPDPHAHNA